MGYGYVNRDDSVRSKTIVRKISNIIIQFVCENLYELNMAPERLVRELWPKVH
jgi:hypothetical protein